MAGAAAVLVFWLVLIGVWRLGQPWIQNAPIGGRRASRE
jgi:hypothetical protein